MKSDVVRVEENLPIEEVKVINRGVWVIDSERNMKIACYVTNTQERVLSLRGTKDALGLVGGGSGALLRSLHAHWIQKYLSDDLKMWVKKMIAKEVLSIKGLNQNEITPISADLFVDILKAYINAQKDGVFKHEGFKIQNQIAERAFMIMTAFAKVGLVSIIDEVTGYQKDREARELQQLLSKYVAKELLPWTRRFPTQFYEEIHRLNSWVPFKEGKNKNPQIGKFTNYLVYDRLPQVVVNKLKEMTPLIKKDDKSYRTRKLHCALTDDGVEWLERLIQEFLAISAGYDTWADFDRHFKRLHKIPTNIGVYSRKIKIKK